MALQKSVGINPAQAVNGDFASTNPRATAVNNNGGFISDGTVVIGLFAWANGNVLSGLVDDDATLTAPTGFVSRTANFAYINGLETETTIIGKGVETTIHVAGDFYVYPTVDVKKGQKVFVDKTRGLFAGDAGATVADAIETNFKYTSDAVVGEIVIISSY